MIFLPIGAFKAFEKLDALLELDIGGCENIDCTDALELLPTLPWVAKMQKLKLAGTNVRGVMPGLIVRLVSEGKASFEGCEGPFTLPEDLSSISDIQKVDLTSLGWNLGGDVSVFEQTPKIKQLNVAPPLSRECYLA